MICTRKRLSLCTFCRNAQDSCKCCANQNNDNPTMELKSNHKKVIEGFNQYEETKKVKKIASLIFDY